MNPDNPTPSGEWTAGQLYDIYKSYHSASDAWHAIANEINAALAAERERADACELQSNNRGRDLIRYGHEIRQLREQLAAEREKESELKLELVRKYSDIITAEREELRTEQRNAVIRTDEIRQLRDKLAAAVAAFTKIKTSLLPTNPCYRIAEHALAKIGGK